MDTKLVRKIKKMFDVDQGFRLCLPFPSPSRGIPGVVMYNMDHAHNRHIHAIIRKYGYPTRSLLGKKGLRIFWLLIQHQDDDLKLQEACLKHCHFAPHERAYLTDRILVNSGEKQLYGTQFHRGPSGNYIPRPIKNRTSVNVRRKRAGLDTLEENTRRIRKYDD